MAIAVPTYAIQTPFANFIVAEKKAAAFKDWAHIEEMFGIFRDRFVFAAYLTLLRIHLTVSTLDCIKTDYNDLKKKSNH